MATTTRGTKGQKKKKTWSYSTGERGRNRVRAREDYPGSVLYLTFSERIPGRARPVRRDVSLGHRDKDQAKRKADALAARFGESGPARLNEDPTLGELFDKYLGEVTPSKGVSKQQHDRRAARMFLEAFGRGFKARAFGRREWDRFIRDRRSGKISPSGEPGPEVGSRVIVYDLKFLASVLNWAASTDEGQGTLLKANPVKGLKMPREETPKRVRVEEAEYRALLDVAPDVDWRFELALVLADQTGRRIGSIRHLRWSDIDLAAQQVRWRKEHDKLGNDQCTPLSKVAVAALKAAQAFNPAVGDAWVFPAPRDASSPCRRDLMTKWWDRAVRLAELPSQERRGWHSVRRKFATELKAVPLVDLKRLGGWESSQTLIKCYQGADEDTMRAALEDRNQRVG